LTVCGFRSRRALYPEELSGHISASIKDKDLASFDLILAMTNKYDIYPVSIALFPYIKTEHCTANLPHWTLTVPNICTFSAAAAATGTNRRSLLSVNGK
jgi:hypothetical protein